MITGSGAMLCDFCAKPANNKVVLDFTGTGFDPNEPWSTSFRPKKMMFCHQCFDGGVKLIRSGCDRIMLF
jgi:hypothetical protein